MKKYKAYWKLDPLIELKEGENLEDAIEDLIFDITTNPHDYIDFEEGE